MNIIKVNYAWKGNLSLGNKPDSIVLHHAEASKCTVADIHSWHLGNGWCGIGYHYFVRKDGTIYTGRPENIIGSHCPTMNGHSIGICAEGEYMTETMPDTQRNAIIALCRDICSRYTITRIVGHKEVPYSTNCPGIKYPLDNIRIAVYALNNTPVTPLVKPISSNINILNLQKSLNLSGYRDADGKKLDEDGFIGNKTYEALDKVVLKIGVDNAMTGWLQSKLGITSDNQFGPATKAAVIAYQKKKGLTQDGIAGKITLRTLL
jgi:N-acetylmuramoyl-L-alanine amidase